MVNIYKILHIRILPCYNFSYFFLQIGFFIYATTYKEHLHHIFEKKNMGIIIIIFVIVDFEESGVDKVLNRRLSCWEII